MRPRERRESGEQDLFRSRLDQVINMDHALVKLARTIDWGFLEESYLNLIAQPTERRWSWWGRVIFYVADVDALYERALAAGYQPTTAPHHAEWGERFFHLTDPDGHELSFAWPLRSSV